MKFKELFSLSQKEIDSAFKNAKLQNKIFGLKLLQAPAENKQTFGKLLIITPRKLGKAHKRNKIRRQLKSIFYQEKLFETPAVSILLIYKNALNLNFEQLKEFLVTSFDSNPENG